MRLQKKECHSEQTPVRDTDNGGFTAVGRKHKKQDKKTKSPWIILGGDNADESYNP